MIIRTLNTCSRSFWGLSQNKYYVMILIFQVRKLVIDISTLPGNCSLMYIFFVYQKHDTIRQEATQNSVIIAQSRCYRGTCQHGYNRSMRG